MKQTGLETELRNTVYHWLRSHKNPNQVKEPLVYLRKAQAQWEKRINKSLNSMAAEIKVNLSQLRTPEERQELMDKWNELSVYDIVLSCRHAPVTQEYLKKGAPRSLRAKLWAQVLGAETGPQDVQLTASNDHQYFVFEDVLYQVMLCFSRDTAVLDVFQHSCATPIHGVLKGKTAMLENTVIYPPNGITPYHGFTMYGTSDHTDPLLEGGRARPGQLRLSGVKPKERRNCYLVITRGYYLIRSSKLVIHTYFSFIYIYFCIQRTFHTYILIFCIFLKFLHISLYIFPATPFCYLYDDPVQLYFVFRAFYMRYWFRLHEVSSHSQGILSMCLLFERLLHKHEPELWVHFKKHSVQPIRLVFKWIMRTFSGHLPPEQVLYLWDLILGNDSMEIVPLLAVNILSIRRENLLSVTSMQNFESVLADLSSIHVMPLLQMCLVNYESDANLSLSCPPTGRQPMKPKEPPESPKS
ncbi:unnamed protein product [Nesidiocoris tenuis]|uniref:Rab-GAP TBC domain-containing protein n=1 Tax=Nesidiocoris tenuis TaxID=355587 RepID=A0A6H5G9W9_9HEMI|nr:unnamed protein product [Nesidiocoris tenuis]